MSVCRCVKKKKKKEGEIPSVFSILQLFLQGDSGCLSLSVICTHTPQQGSPATPPYATHTPSSASPLFSLPLPLLLLLSIFRYYCFAMRRGIESSRDVKKKKCESWKERADGQSGANVMTTRQPGNRRCAG